MSICRLSAYRFSCCLQQIAMRELELWKDKIQLRIRDRIQSSMEQFTRDCLEVDKQVNETEPQTRPPGSTSMEQIYVRAAKLVKRTLDVEGAIVMDVSHVDVLETVGAESSTSITLHDADEGTESQSRTLSRDEYRRLAEFFEKHPQGKVCEGIVHAGLRPFLPTRIQYVLGESELRALDERRRIEIDGVCSLCPAVPIYNIDKRPFALLCAYSTGERTTPFVSSLLSCLMGAVGHGLISEFV